MIELMPTLVSALALIFLAAALYSRNQLKQNKALLADVSSRLESLSQKTKRWEDQSRQADENSNKFRQQAVQLEKQVEDLKQKLSERNHESQKFKTDRDLILERSTLQREHLEEQVKAMSEQLAEAIRDKKELQDEHSKTKKLADNKLQEQLDIVRQQAKETQTGLQQSRREKQQLELELKKVKEEVGHVKPEELQKLKQKLARTEQLYNSMRGLRELAEERNKNWETALRFFTAHVLQKPLGPELQNESIGRLVGEALEHIGVSLVTETRAEAAAAEAAALAAAADRGLMAQRPRAATPVSSTPELES
jgi:chromosome segregation ATPase